MKNKISLFLSLFLLVNTSVSAATVTAKDSFESINNCVQKEDKQGCKDLLTASSASLYSRFMSYGLMNCLPKDAGYVSQQKIGNYVMIRASVTDNSKKRFMRLFFVEEEGTWKLDVPESLSTSMGKNWEQQIEVVEQLYLLMKQQFGTQLDCRAIRNLVRVNK